MWFLKATGVSMIWTAVSIACLAAEPMTASPPAATNAPATAKEKPSATSEKIVPIEKVERVDVERFDDKKQVDFPWGWIRWIVTAKQNPGAEMTYGIVYIKPHQANPLHMHPNCTEYLHVLEGSCEHLVGDKWVKLKAGDVARIPKRVQHMARTGDEGLKAVIVYDNGDRQVVTLGEGKE
jgi:quercetin dioxygenase-like cupin family protein